VIFESKHLIFQEIFPEIDCVWSKGCLEDLSGFIRGLMIERKVRV
jgi:hypothetical protein